jgi:hypothetical protein
MNGQIRNGNKHTHLIDDSMNIIISGSCFTMVRYMYLPVDLIIDICVVSDKGCESEKDENTRFESE